MLQVWLLYLICRDVEHAAREAARRKLMCDVAATWEQQLATQQAKRQDELKQVYRICQPVTIL